MTPSEFGGRILRAAGAVVTRDGPRGPEVLVVHRPGYHDWTIPKGKVELGELPPATAVREVAEETGVTIRLEAPLGRIEYQVGEDLKVVDYWGASALSTIRRAPDAEVDVVSWLPVRLAMVRLTYPADRELVQLRLSQPPTTAMILVRHAKAMNRKDWTKADQQRPIDARGRRQARQLIPVFDAYGVNQLVSSAANRCVQTLQPYAQERGLGLLKYAALTEEQGVDRPKTVRRLIRQFRDEAAHQRQPIAVCGHRPVLPTMLAALDVPDRQLRTAECGVFHLDDAGRTVAVEWLRPG